MRVLSFNVYSFNELSEEAQKKAWEKHVNHLEYVWVDEGIDSLNKFAGALGIKITNYEIGTYGRSFVHTNADRDAFRGIGFKKAVDMIVDNTNGYCVYETMKDQFIKSMKDHGDMKNSFLESIDAGLQDIVKDMEYQESLEYFKEMAENNEYEFYDNGNLI
jgi:hypothetical protein